MFLNDVHHSQYEVCLRSYLLENNNINNFEPSHYPIYFNITNALMSSADRRDFALTAPETMAGFYIHCLCLPALLLYCLWALFALRRGRFLHEDMIYVNDKYIQTSLKQLWRDLTCPLILAIFFFYFCMCSAVGRNLFCFFICPVCAVFWCTIASWVWPVPFGFYIQ